MGRRASSVLAVLAAAGLAVASPAPAHGPDRHAAELEGGPVDGGVLFQQPMALAAQRREEPPAVATPRADCLPGGIPEGELQGRVAAEDIASGRVRDGYRCNLSVIGRTGSTGGFRVHRYVDRNGHECAYYDTTLLFPTNALSLSLEPTGVAVLDMTDPAHPRRTATLSTIAMQTPHESLNISVERGLLAAVMGNPGAAPGIVDVYDISQDCRRPVLQASAPASIFGHESGMAPDGRTFYPTSISTNMVTAVDLSDPRLPRPLWQGQYNAHGMSVSDDGTRGYIAASEGLVIVDLSEVQARRPNPQVREISRLTWKDITIPQVAIPVTIKGRPYVVEVDEYSTDDSGGFTSHGSRVGAARIIDVSDERAPFVVSNIRLGVHQREHRAAIAGDPGARNPVQGYAAHYCNVPQRNEPGIVACSMIASGLRVFDIRDPERPKELAYFVAPPSTISATGAPVIDQPSNWAMSQPAFVPERGEIWYSDGTSGFYALKLDPRVWPFPTTTTGGAGSRAACTETSGFVDVAARPAGRGLELDFTRRAQLPVRIDVFRVSQGRRVLRERLVQRFDGRTGLTRWNGRGAGPGVYFARFVMRKPTGGPYDSRRIVLARDRRGRWRVRPTHHQRETCGLLRRFKLHRPVFGGTSRTALSGVFQLTATGRVTVTVERRGKVVKRFATTTRRAGETVRFTLPSRRLARGDYVVRLVARSGEDQIAAQLVARRL